MQRGSSQLQSHSASSCWKHTQNWVTFVGELQHQLNSPYHHISLSKLGIAVGQKGSWDLEWWCWLGPRLKCTTLIPWIPLSFMLVDRLALLSEEAGPPFLEVYNTSPGAGPWRGTCLRIYHHLLNSHVSCVEIFFFFFCYFKKLSFFKLFSNRALGNTADSLTSHSLFQNSLT